MRYAVVLTLGVITLAWGQSQAMALKTHTFVETFGSAAHPGLINPIEVAVDESTGDVLVAAAGPQGAGTGAGTLSRFHSDGTPAPFSALGTNTIGGFTFGQFSNETQIAVDSSGSATAGNIYVTQLSSSQVLEFNAAGEQIGTLTGGAGGAFGAGPCGVAVDESGRLFVSTRLDAKLYEYAPGVNPPVNADGREIASPVSEPCTLNAGVGADQGTLFVGFSNVLRLGERESGVAAVNAASGTVEYKFGASTTTGPVTATTLDASSGHLYLRRAEAGTISEFSPTPSEANLVSEFSLNTHQQGGIAVAPTSGRLYVANNPQNTAPDTIEVYSALVTVPNVLTDQAVISGETTAELRGTVEPEGVEIDECFFEYGLTIGYGQTAPCEDPDALEIGGGSSPVSVHADIQGLSPESRYHFRLVAKNAEGQTGSGSDVILKTPSKPSVVAEWAAEVGGSNATLAANINPENAATTYRLEWGLDATYGHVTAALPLGEDATDHEVTAALDGLAPGTTYHYRFVAKNHLGEGKGPDRSFTTVRTPTETGSCPNELFRTGESTALPDCRAYEMVSHAEEDGGDILQMININSDPAALDQVAVSGNAITYSTYKAFDNAVSAPYVTQYIARRVEGGGWESSALNPPYGVPLDNPVPFLDIEFRAFSPDLCDGWLVQAPNTLELAPGRISGYANLFQRSNCGATAYSTVTATNLRPTVAVENFKPDLQGVSSDGSTAVFSVQDKLTDEATAGQFQVYASAEGKLRLVCVLPTGVHFTGSCSTGTASAGKLPIRHDSVHNAVSADGSRVYWSAEGIEGGVSRIFLRTNPTKIQSKISAGKCTEVTRACTVPVSETAGAGNARFWGASRDGSKAIFEMTATRSLYRFEAQSGTANLIAGQVLGVLGASETLGQIYLVSEEVLAAGGTPGEPNVYLDEIEGGGGFRYVTTLTGPDVQLSGNGVNYSPISREPTLHTAQVTPSGKQLVFMSRGSLTGYDNIDQRTGKPDAEVFLYDATANAGAGALVCVSCNPTGARARGGFMERETETNALPAAAFITTAETELYAPRVVSESGNRVYFTSFEGLAPSDSNGTKDVYEWEAPGLGSCTANSSAYSSQDDGCIELISSGDGASGATFVDSDPEGGNVFFTTEASLRPEDTGLIDIYDARVDGGLPERSAKVECEGADCQRSGPAPGGGTVGTAVSRALGNVIPGKPKCPKGKKPVHRKGRVVCVKRHPKGAHNKNKKKSTHHKGKGEKKPGADKHGGGVGR
jgi:hypothetical protein